MATIGSSKVVALASLFVISRIFYTIGYILGSITKITTLRVLGFALGLLVNLSMIAYHLGFNIYEVLTQHVTPLAKDFL